MCWYLLLIYYAFICYILLKDLLKWYACICQRMALLSAAEKQRRYRAHRDADPERGQQYLNKEKVQWTKDREA